MKYPWAASNSRNFAALLLEPNKIWLLFNVARSDRSSNCSTTLALNLFFRNFRKILNSRNLLVDYVEPFCSLMTLYFIFKRTRLPVFLLLVKHV